jgi:glycosyltransferase involved in cell wall biosynthesis
MRIVIDLQACQSTGSRHRGIGRYSLSLAKAMLENAKDHDCHLLLSGLFPETIADLRRTFAAYLPPEKIHVWQAAQPVAELLSENKWRCRTAELVREQALAALRPDMVHVTSLFEGSGDNAVGSIAANGNALASAVTLYDLIPLVYKKQYLTTEAQQDWYYRKLISAKRADLLLAISEATRQEGIDYLQLSPEKVVNISSAVDPQFTVRSASDESMLALRQRYGLLKPYVMYTGGIDLRKNIDGLIEAYAGLPGLLRQQHQLAIVCSVQAHDRERLLALAARYGLAEQDLVLTGFVPDHDLPLLYQECKLFVFPSWHEGFGLPALEAMSCGVPVIAANTSSLPEVLGCQDALFDPRSIAAITSKMLQVLSDTQFAGFLREHGLKQAQQFSWDASGKKAIAAFEHFHAQTKNQKRHGILDKKPFSSAPLGVQKLRCAYISPLPAVASGIADYSAELIPALAEHYEMTLIVSQDNVADAWLRAGFQIKDARWFTQNRAKFDRVLYHFGNSPAHLYMYALFDRFPGTIVLHDFFLGDSLAYVDLNDIAPGLWTKLLYEAHAYPALLALRAAESHLDLIRRYPCSPALTLRADGVIVHSNYSKALATKWMGAEIASQWEVVPHLRRLPHHQNKLEARIRLGLDQDAFLVCAFGMLGPTKLNQELVQAWDASTLAHAENCHLVFVGQNDSGSYGAELEAMLNNSPARDRMKITGYADIELYRTYLQAADLAVQLRTQSRGESSGTVVDCMAYGLPLIINRNGAMAEVREDVAHGLEDQFSLIALQTALEQMFGDPALRQRLGTQAQAFIAQSRDPASIALAYWDAIEHQSQSAANALMHQTLRQIAAVEATSVSDQDWRITAQALAHNKTITRAPVIHLLVDDTDVDSTEKNLSTEARLLVECVLSEFNAGRIEFVRTSPLGLRYARRWAWRNFDLRYAPVSDDLVHFQAGDYLLAKQHEIPDEIDLAGLTEQVGVRVVFDTISDAHALHFTGRDSDLLQQMMNQMVHHLRT